MKKRNVAIIGCGQTKHSSRRRDVNVAELVSEAVYNALEDLIDRTRECLSRSFRSKSRSGLTSPKNQMADS